MQAQRKVRVSNITFYFLFPFFFFSILLILPRPPRPSGSVEGKWSGVRGEECKFLFRRGGGEGGLNYSGNRGLVNSEAGA